MKNKPKGVEIQNIGEFSSDFPYYRRIGIMIKGIKKVLDVTKDESCIYYLIRNDIALLFTMISSKPYIFEEADMTHLCNSGGCCGFLLQHSMTSFMSNKEVDVPLIYADYYYLEAVSRLMEL